MMIGQMRARLESCKSFEQVIHSVLSDAISLQGAEFGNVQLLDGDELAIVAQRGFSLQFLKTFWRVGAKEGTACGRALRAGVPITIRDVEKDGEFAPFRSHARLAGFRGVQSTPIVSTDGKPLGIVSTHFAKVHEPTRIEMETLLAYGSIAAEFLLQHLGDRSLATMARRMSEELGASMTGTEA
jgi:two-component system, sensor histidine kinase